MPQFPGFEDLDASQDAFITLKYSIDSMFMLQPNITGGSNGTATYTIMASNIEEKPLVEANFEDYRPNTATDVPINTSVDATSFTGLYFAIKYTAGTATGVLNFWLVKKEDR
jgi:hypothetical protein